MHNPHEFLIVVLLYESNFKIQCLIKRAKMLYRRGLNIEVERKCEPNFISD